MIVKHSVELFGFHAEYRLKHLGTALAASVGAQHVDQHTVTPVTLDEFTHQRRQVIGEYHLLRIRRTHKPVVEFTHRMETVIHIG